MRTLVVLGFEDSPLRGFLVRRAARLVRRIRRIGEAVVVAAVPEGRTLPAELGEVMSPAQMLRPDDVRRMHEWVLDTSRRVLEELDPGSFPTVFGVSLAQLNLLAIQEYLTGFALLNAAVRRSIERFRPDQCSVMAHDPQVARALTDTARGAGVRTSTWSPGVMHRVRVGLDALESAILGRTLAQVENQAATEAARLVKTLGHPAAEPTVLVLSESRPMAQTFTAIEAQLRDWGGRVHRLQLASDRLGREDHGNTTIWHIPSAPGLGPKAEAVPRIRDTRRVRMPADLATVDVLLESTRVSVVPQQVAHLVQLKCLLDALRPALVVVGNDRWWVGQALVQLARRRGIPSLMVQDGISGDVPAWSWTTADHIAAASEAFGRQLVRHGLEMGRCHVVGQPRYDSLRAVPAQAAQQQARAALGLAPTVPLAMVATQPIHDASYLTQVVNALLAVDGVHVLLRPHPSQPQAAHQLLMRQGNDTRITLHASEDILTLLHAVDIVISQHSTVLLEADILGKVAISANFSGQPDVPFVYADLVQSVHTPQALTALTATLVARQETGLAPGDVRNSQIEDLLGPVDGFAAVRAADLIRTLAGSGACRLAAAVSCG